MSRRYRVRYYDAFSRVYDRFVAAHSSDRQGRLREVLAERTSLVRGDRALDLSCWWRRMRNGCRFGRPASMR
ncbi:MAG: hypothetical protein P8099_05220 [Gemmatimonadota bacterium]